MPLQKTTIPIALATGLDTQNDPKQLAPGAMLELENARFRKGMRIHKRYGYDALTTGVETSGNVPASIASDGSYQASGMYGFGSELLQFSGRRVYSYGAQTGRWLDKGQAPSVSVKSRTIVRSDTIAQASPDSALSNGLECYVYEESAAGAGIATLPGCSYSIIDTATGTRIVSDAPLSPGVVNNTNGIGQPRVIATPTGFLLFYSETNNSPQSTGVYFDTSVKCRVISAAAPTVLGPEVFVSNVGSTDFPHPAPFDAVWTGTQAVVVQAPGAPGGGSGGTGGNGGPVTITWLSPAGVVLAQGQNAQVSGETSVDLTLASAPAGGAVRVIATLSSASAATVTVTALAQASPSAYPDSQWTYATTSAVVRATSVYAPASTSPMAPVAQPATGLTTLGGLSSYIGQAPSIVTFIEVSQAPVTLNGIAVSPGHIISMGLAQYVVTQNTFTASTFGPFQYLQSVGLASKPLAYRGSVAVAVVFSSPYQATYFLCDASGQCLARAASGLAGGYRNGPQLPNPARISPTAFQIAAEVKGRLQTSTSAQTGNVGPQTYTLLGVQRLVFDFGAQTAYVGGINARSLHLTGGFVSVYDGAQAVEQNFHLYPEGVQAVTGGSVSAGTGMLPGAYQYIAVYEWTDAFGQVVRSTTSITASITTIGTGAVNSAYVYVPYLPLTAKSAVRVALFRTEANGILFYRCRTFTNDPTTYGGVVFDQLPDSQLISNDILYTTGGVLDHMPFPACRCMTSHQGRLFVSGLEDPTELRFSNLTQYGTPCDTNDLLSIRIDPRWGTIAALESMDAYLLIFTEKAVLALSGDGPDATGQGSFSTPQLLSSDTGCVNVNSVVRTPQGVMFQGAKGLMLVSSGASGSGYQAVQYVGGPVENYLQSTPFTITAATLVPSQSEVRFMTRDSVCLVYSYLYSQWSVYSGLSSVDADLWAGRYVCLRPDGRVYAENTARFDDNGALVRIRLRTGWLSLAGMQQVQRVYRLLVLGEYKSTHSLAVSVAYNFVDAPNPATVINADLVQTQGAFAVGGDAQSTFASQTPFAGLPQPYQHRIHLARQKCQAIQVTLEESQPAALAVNGAYGEGLNLSSLALEVGVKGQMGKQGQGSSYGA